MSSIVSNSTDLIDQDLNHQQVSFRQERIASEVTASSKATSTAANMAVAAETVTTNKATGKAPGKGTSKATGKGTGKQSNLKESSPDNITTLVAPAPPPFDPLASCCNGQPTTVVDTSVVPDLMRIYENLAQSKTPDVPPTMVVLYDPQQKNSKHHQDFSLSTDNTNNTCNSVAASDCKIDSKAIPFNSIIANSSLDNPPLSECQPKWNCMSTTTKTTSTVLSESDPISSSMSSLVKVKPDTIFSKCLQSLQHPTTDQSPHEQQQKQQDPDSTASTATTMTKTTKSASSRSLRKRVSPSALDPVITSAAEENDAADITSKTEMENNTNKVQSSSSSWSVTSSRKNTVKRRKVGPNSSKSKHPVQSNEDGINNSNNCSNNEARWSKRFTWPEYLHRDFVSAIFDVGLKHSSPATVLEQMKPHEQITTERVKSHLQKYRLHRQKSKQDFMTDYEATVKKLQEQQGSYEGIVSLSGGKVAGQVAYATMTNQSSALTTTPTVPVTNSTMVTKDDPSTDVSASTPADHQLSSSCSLVKIDNTHIHDQESLEVPQESNYLVTMTTNKKDQAPEETLLVPKLTLEEKLSPIGASMAHMVGLFMSLSQQLHLQRAQRHEQQQKLVQEEQRLEKLRQGELRLEQQKLEQQKLEQQKLELQIEQRQQKVRLEHEGNQSAHKHYQQEQKQCDSSISPPSTTQADEEDQQQAAAEVYDSFVKELSSVPYETRVTSLTSLPSQPPLPNMASTSTNTTTATLSTAGLVSISTSTVPPPAPPPLSSLVVPNSTLSNLEENNLMKQEMKNQMAFQNKMRALKQQEINKYKSQVVITATSSSPTTGVVTASVPYVVEHFRDPTSINTNNANLHHSHKKRQTDHLSTIQQEQLLLLPLRSQSQHQQQHKVQSPYLIPRTTDPSHSPHAFMLNHHHEGISLTKPLPNQHHSKHATPQQFTSNHLQSISQEQEYKQYYPFQQREEYEQDHHTIPPNHHDYQDTGESSSHDDPKTTDDSSVDHLNNRPAEDEEVVFWNTDIDDEQLFEFLKEM